MTTAEIQDRFGIADALRFEDAPGGLRRAVISTAQAEAVVYLHGAHVTAWTPRGQRPVLFTSSRSAFEPGKPIRGGVPIVFPWFGPRGGGLAGPMHGFARIREWTVEGARVLDNGSVSLEFTLAESAHVRFRVTAGAALAMELTVRNDGGEAFPFEEALHTYFAVGDIHQVAVTGLEGAIYLDKTDSFRQKQQPAEPIRITGETDRIYLDTEAECVLHDPAWQRRIIVEKSGSHATVVWNPWIEKNRNLPDMAPEDWRGMICIETANAAANAVTLAPGASHTLTALIRIE